MRRLVQDLGDLTGLDIVAAARCSQVRDPAGRRVGATLAALRWLGLTPAGDGRCRRDERSDAIGARVSRAHGCGIRTD